MAAQDSSNDCNCNTYDNKRRQIKAMFATIFAVLSAAFGATGFMLKALGHDENKYREYLDFLGLSTFVLCVVLIIVWAKRGELPFFLGGLALAAVTNGLIYIYDRVTDKGLSLNPRYVKWVDILAVDFLIATASFRVLGL